MESALAHGESISYGFNPDGSRKPYELNITWYDALNDPSNPDPDLDVRRFLASQAIMLSLVGVPGIYLHSLLGSRNCTACVEETGRARSINREKFLLADLEQELEDPDSLKWRVLSGYRQLLQIRKQQPAFNPAAEQQVLSTNPAVFALVRAAAKGSRLICLTNVTGKPIQTEIRLAEWDLPENSEWIDLLADEIFEADDRLRCNLAPYQSRWLRGKTDAGR